MGGWKWEAFIHLDKLKIAEKLVKEEKEQWRKCMASGVKEGVIFTCISNKKRYDYQWFWHLSLWNGDIWKLEAFGQYVCSVLGKSQMVCSPVLGC